MSRMRVNNTEIADAQIFEILLDNFPDMIHSVDEDGNIVFTNKRAETLLGYAHDELLSMNVRELYHEDVLNAVDSGFDDLKKTGDAWIPESFLKAKDGTKIPVDIRSFSIYDDDDAFIRTFSILRDIRPIKKLQNDLIHAGRLAAIGEMASGIAHDINNPLTAILLANHLIASQAKKINEGADVTQQIDRVVDFSGDVDRASKSIQKLVDHLRNFSRGMAESIETVNLADTIADALFITTNKINKTSTRASNAAEGGTYYVKGSPNQLEQIIVNLISNACDAMEDLDKRELSIVVSACDRDGKAFWRCDVTDTGTGIPEGTAKEIFQSFFTTKEKGKGTGLGLSISRGIAREHDGDIELSSEPGNGTMFSVFLPQVEAPATDNTVTTD